MEHAWSPGLPVWTCGIWGELVPESALRWVALYINGQPMGLSAQVHAGLDGSPLHPELLSDRGGSGVGADDVWEWRLES